MTTASLPPDDEIAAGWSQVARALESAQEAWAAVSPDTTGPIAELLRHASWNATVWNLKAQGMPRMEAWRAADAEHGRMERCYVDFDPEGDNGSPDI